MADRYIDVAFVDRCIDRSVRESLLGDEAAPGELLSHIEDATDQVKGYLRNSGYACPETQDPAEVDGIVRKAVMCVIWETLSMKPNNSLALPEGWATGTYRSALADILSGAAQLPLAQNTGSAPGGITVGTVTSRATDLSGW